VKVTDYEENSGETGRKEDDLAGQPLIPIPYLSS
jgi:hypothetical protein